MKLKFSDWATNARTVAMFKREEYYKAEIARLCAAAAIVGELAALVPLSEAIPALRTGATMVRWFKTRLEQLTAENKLLKEAAERAIIAHTAIALREPQVVI